MPANLAAFVAATTNDLVARDSNPSDASRPPVYKAVGLTLAVASGLFIGISFVLKKVGLLKANVKYNEEAGEGYGYLKNAFWWTGMTLMIIGEICNFVAYAFVDAILVTPLGALSVVVTTILSAIFLKERLSFVGKIGCFMCIIGSVIIVLNAPEQSSAANIQQMQQYVIAPGFLSYAGVIIIACVFIALWAGPRYGKKSMLVYLTICSLIGGLSVVSTQGLGAAIVAQAGGTPQFNQWFLYVLLVFVVCTLLTEIVYLNKALNLFNAALVTPTYYVYFTSSTIVASAVLFRGFKGTPLSIATIIMGFLQICAGVVLLQLSKSAKDVPDSAVLKGDLDQIRTVGEQEQPESEPKADALRGAAALIRRISVARQKMEADEAKRVYEDKLRDQMEPIREGEQVEWDGLRRRKTTLHSNSVSRTKTIHPPLGLSKFPSYEDDAAEFPAPDDVPHDGDIKGGALHSPRRRTGSSRISFSPPFSPRPSLPAHDELPKEGETTQLGSGDNMEMSHVYGLPPGLRSPSNSGSRASPGPTQGRPIMWASDVENKPKKNVSLAPPSPRSLARRQFSFQNMFHKNKDGGKSRDQTQHLQIATEEERLGLTRGDSNTNSSDEEGSPARGIGTSADALPLSTVEGGVSELVPHGRQWSDSSPELRLPAGSRTLPPLPTEGNESEDDGDFEKQLKETESYRRPGAGGSGGGAFI